MMGHSKKTKNLTARRSEGFGSEAGVSLVEMMIAIGIMGILMAAFATMSTNQVRETRALGEKLASLELERAITAALGHKDICGTLFTTGNLVTADSTTFDATTVTASNPHTIKLKKIMTAGGLELAAAGGPASPMSNTLKILSTDGIQLVLSHPNAGVLHVNFDQSELVRRINDLRFDLVLKTQGPASATVITGCSTSSSPDALQESAKWESVSMGNTATFDPMCAYRFFVTGSLFSYGMNGMMYATSVSAYEISAGSFKVSAYGKTYASNPQWNGDSQSVYDVGGPVSSIEKLCNEKQ